jgi:hypothetical protein
MKKSLGVSFLAVLLAACADSGQGGGAVRESGTNSSAARLTDPALVAPDLGSRPVVSTNAVYETPAKPVPVPPEEEARPSPTPKIQESTPVQEGQRSNEQGTQVSPEPRTGDDANPDLNPRR